MSCGKHTSQPADPMIIPPPRFCEGQLNKSTVILGGEAEIKKDRDARVKFLVSQESARCHCYIHIHVCVCVCVRTYARVLVYLLATHNIQIVGINVRILIFI